MYRSSHSTPYRPVSSDVPGLRDSVRDGETGLLYPFGDIDALSTAIIRMLTETGLREQLVTNARRWAQRFSWNRVADDVENLLESAIEPSREPDELTASPFA